MNVRQLWMRFLVYRSNQLLWIRWSKWIVLNLYHPSCSDYTGGLGSPIQWCFPWFMPFPSSYQAEIWYVLFWSLWKVNEHWGATFPWWDSLVHVALFRGNSSFEHKCWFLKPAHFFMEDSRIYSGSWEFPLFNELSNAQLWWPLGTLKIPLCPHLVASIRSLFHCSNLDIRVIESHQGTHNGPEGSQAACLLYHLKIFKDVMATSPDWR